MKYELIALQSERHGKKNRGNEIELKQIQIN